MRQGLPIVATLLVVLLPGTLATSSPTAGIVSKWRFEKAALTANEVEGAPSARIERARSVSGKEGDALEFSDWSVENYVKPDPGVATRVVVDPGGSPDALNPALPFRVSAWIYPTADPVYYGGIVEKGGGYGASYRLVLLRGLRVSGSLGGAHATVRSPDPLSLNTWHEITLVAETASLALVVDGREVGRTALGSQPALASSDPVIIGERFSGRIDEVTITR